MRDPQPYENINHDEPSANTRFHGSGHALVEWRTPREWLRLMVPVKLRAETEEGVSVANVVSGAFPARRRPECMRGEGLIADTREP